MQFFELFSIVLFIVFLYHRRRSELIIKSAFVNDSGQYECRAKNKLARHPIRKFTRIDVLPKAQEYSSKYLLCLSFLSIGIFVHKIKISKT